MTLSKFGTMTTIRLVLQGSFREGGAREFREGEMSSARRSPP